MTLEGGLGIDLYHDGKRVRRVVIRSTRPFQAQQLLRGKSATTALSMLPLMYNVCAHAQALAGLQACRRALGRDSASDVIQAQRLLVDLESLREHLWRMSVDWPQLSGETLSPQVGVLSRLTARIVEVVSLMQSLRRDSEKLIRGEVDAVDQSVSQSIGEGIGQVEAARGRLLHWVRLENERIEDYRILAPTEWDFHPDGVAAAGLKSLVSDDETMLRLQARCWLDAIDPCVAYEVRLH